MNRVNTSGNKNNIFLETNVSKKRANDLNNNDNSIRNNENSNNICKRISRPTGSFFILPWLISPNSPLCKIPNLSQKNESRKSPHFDLRYLDDSNRRIKIEQHLSSGKTLKCHYKNCNDREYTTLYEYNMHCHNYHPKQPLHPELSLIKLLGIESRGNPWEM